jgi:hypothetical protein
MALDAVAYAAMAWYFEQVIPNEVRSLRRGAKKREAGGAEAQGQ